MVSDLVRLVYGSSADVFTKIGALEGMFMPHK